MKNEFKKELPDLLLPWYAENDRTMPWRVPSPDPYWVLVSELMLQQTRVETVIPYFTRFIQTLPDIPALAKADEELLLKLWEGLGYYSRVRNLQKAAIKTMELYHGKLPSSVEKLRDLPGVGDYTAGAIASIAFGLPEPAVDGNVLRVSARLLNYQENILQPEFRVNITQMLRKIYPAGHCSEFTQSLMDLGAMICIPGHPRCENCPLQMICKAKAAGTQEMLPVKTPKATRKVEEKTVLLLYCADKLALRKRAGKGVLAGMWELPWLPGHLTEEELRSVFPDLKQIKYKRAGKHVFTHLEWNMKIWEIHIPELQKEYIWASSTDLAEHYSLPSAFKKFI